MILRTTISKPPGFLSGDSITGNTIQQVNTSVQPGLQPIIDNTPDYNQTVIKYVYPVEEGQSRFSSQSGVIENEKDIWMHLPRDKYFRILELNPFPFIKAPYEIGNKWKWELEIGSFLGDEKWKTWEGSITINMNTRLQERKVSKPNLEFWKFFEITGTASSRIA